MPEFQASISERIRNFSDSVLLTSSIFSSVRLFPCRPNRSRTSPVSRASAAAERGQFDELHVLILPARPCGSPENAVGAVSLRHIRVSAVEILPRTISSVMTSTPIPAHHLRDFMLDERIGMVGRPATRSVSRPRHRGCGAESRRCSPCLPSKSALFVERPESRPDLSALRPAKRDSRSTGGRVAVTERNGRRVERDRKIVDAPRDIRNTRPTIGQLSLLISLPPSGLFVYDIRHQNAVYAS